MTSFIELYAPKIITAFSTHLYYVLTSVGIAFLFALALGILLSRVPRFAGFILPLLSIFQTIPGIVFIGVLFLLIGMKPLTVIVALTVYAVFPILKNTYVGIVEVDDFYKEAAKGCGMSSLQILWAVELPLARKAIITGLRMSTVYTVSWAVLASMIGLGGLGDLIYAGISSNNNSLILAGALPAAIMALSLSYLLGALNKALIPKAIRRDSF